MYRVEMHMNPIGDRVIVERQWQVTEEKWQTIDRFSTPSLYVMPEKRKPEQWVLEFYDALNASYNQRGLDDGTVQDEEDDYFDPNGSAYCSLHGDFYSGLAMCPVCKVYKDAAAEDARNPNI